MKQTKLIYLDTCQPDYFQGFGGETLIAFHWSGQTVAEALANLKSNATNECHAGEVYQAIDDLIEQNKDKADELMIDESFCEPDESGDTGLVHYFGVITEEDDL